MKKYILGCLLVSFAFSCKEGPKKEEIIDTAAQTEEQITLNTYPQDFFKVLNAHGGLDNWKQYKTLYFDLPKPASVETHIVDLYRRTDKIIAETYSLGFDGKDVWLMDEAGSYEGKPKFYHNLMFYFYAMPFVLADEGLNYEEIPALVVDGVSYPGFHITFNNGVGASSKDEYFLHYDPETFQMKWLGYTVTYFSDAPSNEISWIEYANWNKVGEVLLPSAISWYSTENNNVKDRVNTVKFENAKLLKSAEPTTFFAKPSNAKVVD
ncbi:hypothetical protein Q2T41_16290 [Maribacter confluentis]|uniref:Threonine synthase n=1 Tax=Maribacter confluentis TaxID=1656093 RepID=A0ABT8RUV6_9FLAO|nr:DUF6503 family protein [Maribacter confluentis]MDO1514214.1 hypothetical protein [Maribacter confluentis]